MAFIEPCFGIGHNLSLICQMTSEDIKHQLITVCYSFRHVTLSYSSWGDPVRLTGRENPWPKLQCVTPSYVQRAPARRMFLRVSLSVSPRTLPYVSVSGTVPPLPLSPPPSPLHPPPSTPPPSPVFLFVCYPPPPFSLTVLYKISIDCFCFLFRY